MDRTIQSLIRGIVLTFVICFNFSTFGQCSDSIRIIKSDSCEVVQMSTTTFTEFYLCKKNLEILSKELPNANNTLDSLHKVNKEIRSNLQSEVDTVNAQKDIMKVGLNECYVTLVEVDLDNMYLQYDLDKEKKKKWPNRAIGAGIFVVGTWLVKTVIKSIIP